MKCGVFYYSLTGNNETLGISVANALSADCIKITEEKVRTNGTIISDMLFNKTPEIKPVPDCFKNYDFVLFIAPVWLGKVASPLRAYFKYIKKNPMKYAFASISGGALNDNPKLGADLEKRAGIKPAALMNLYISDLLPQDPKPTMEQTSAYHINEADKIQMSDAIVKTIRSIL
jgi:hypothetical protein